ncbi:MAG: hypothetical protein VW715_16890, partial [Rhodospirillales bacterium]
MARKRVSKRARYDIGGGIRFPTNIPSFSQASMKRANEEVNKVKAAEAGVARGQSKEERAAAIESQK